MFEVRTLRGRILLQIAVTLLVLPFLFPLITMVQGSLAGDGWGNYRAVLGVPLLGRFFVNTVIIAASVIAIVYAVTMLAAYGFGKLHIRGREVYFWLLLACLTLPEVVLLAPLFTTAQALGFFDTYWAVILPIAALQVPFAVLLARNFVNGIPDELFEAARVDGASYFGLFRRIAMPLAIPSFIIVFLFEFQSSWNNLQAALIYLNAGSVEGFTVPLGIAYAMTKYSPTNGGQGDYQYVMVASLLVTLPMLVLFAFGQRYFIEGVATQGRKG